MGVLSLCQDSKHVDLLSLSNDSMYVVHPGDLGVLLDLSAVSQFWLYKEVTVRENGFLYHG